MSTIKTAISIDRNLFEQIEVLSKELNVSRSKVFAAAIEEFLERYENEKIFHALNSVYDDKSDDEELKLQENYRKYHKKLIEPNGY